MRSKQGDRNEWTVSVKSGGVATFGLYVENLHPSQDDLAVRIREHREQIALARDAGFSSIVFGHHLLTAPIQMIAPLSHISSVIDLSGDMRLCTGILLLPLLNPVLLAEELASIDWLSGGRLVIGVGLGYRPEEFQAAGVEVGTRVGRFNEALEVMMTMWSSEGPWSFNGKWFHYEDLPGGLKPRQQPNPPLWIAADADNAVRRAAKWDGAWYINPRAALESLRRQLPIYDQALRDYGHSRPTVFPIRREAFLADSDKEAISTAVRYLSRQLELYKGWGQYQVMPDSDSPSQLAEDDIPDTYLVGTPSHVAELMNSYIDALGVNHFVLRMQWPGIPHRKVMKSIAMVGENLISLFGGAGKGKRRTPTPLADS